MATKRYRYEARHPVTGLLIDPNLRLINPKWSRYVADNGQMSAGVAVPDPADVGGQAHLDRLRAATEPLSSAWYVKNATTGQYVWGGPVVAQKWAPRGASLEVSAVDWRAWFYQVPLIPNLITGRDTPYRWTNTDQISIARQIATYVLAEPGSPPIVMPPYVASGVTRDYQVYGSELKSAGDAIDEVCSRAGGFEWSVEIRTVDGAPRPEFVTWYPQRGVGTPPISLRQGANLISYGPVERSGEQRYSRFWAVGAGQAPDVVMAHDTDPALASGAVLRFEGSASHTSVVKRSTLASHARAARLFFSQGIQTLAVSVPLNKPDVDSYEPGYRARLQIRDRWLSIDLPAVRILSKEVNAQGAGRVDLLLDLSDSKLPDVDPG